MSRTMAVHVRYKSLYISLPSSAKLIFLGKRMLVIFRILHFWLCVIFSLYIRYGLDSFIILDLLYILLLF